MSVAGFYTEDEPKIWSFHVVWQRTATKCTKIYNARAQLLFVSLNLLFGDVPVAVVVCLRSLLMTRRRRQQVPVCTEYDV